MIVTQIRDQNITAAATKVAIDGIEGESKEEILALALKATGETEARLFGHAVSKHQDGTAVVYLHTS